MGSKKRGLLADLSSLEMAEHLLEQARIGLEESAPGSIAYGQMLRAMRDFHAAIVESKSASNTATGLDGMTDEELVSVVEAAIVALPEVLVVRIRDAADARIGGAHLRVVSGKKA